MTLAHIMGVPVEEGALALAPAGAVMLLAARAGLARIADRLRRHPTR
jgi:hypothetical protein